MVRRHGEALREEGGGRVQSEQTPEKSFSPTSDTEGTTLLLLKDTRKRYNPPRCSFTPRLGLSNDDWAKGRVPLQRLESKE